MNISSTNTSVPNAQQLRDELLRQKVRERVYATRAKAAAQLEQIRIEVAKRQCATMKGFVAYFWDVVEPGTDLRWNWHLDVLCEDLEALERGSITKEIVNVPPGTMKSLLMSVFFRAKLWSKNPRLRFLTGSYGSNLSMDQNVKLRDIIQSKKYKELYPHVVLSGDQNAKEFIKTTCGGWSIATSVGGLGTGLHPDYVVVDDPLTAQEALSEADRSTANKWIERTISTRGKTRNVRFLLVMQRLNEEDPTGFLLRKGGYTHRRFPMRFIPTKTQEDGTVVYADPKDQRTVEGELLWPELFSEKIVRELEIDLGPYGAAGQLQQRPAPEGGGLFKREWFKYIETAPVGTRYVRGWDTAATEGDGDYTAGVKMGEYSQQYYVQHVYREQISSHGVDLAMKSFAKSDGVLCSVREQKEPGSAGKAVVTSRAKDLAGSDYNFIPIAVDKVTNAKPFRAQCEAGNVFIVRTGDPIRDAWIEPYLAELSVFPVGSNDDQVDGSSTAFNALVAEKPMLTSSTWGRKR